MCVMFDYSPGPKRQTVYSAQKISLQVVFFGFFSESLNINTENMTQFSKLF